MVCGQNFKPKKMELTVSARKLCPRNQKFYIQFQLILHLIQDNFTYILSQLNFCLLNVGVGKRNMNEMLKNATFVAFFLRNHSHRKIHTNLHMHICVLHEKQYNFCLLNVLFMRQPREKAVFYLTIEKCKYLSGTRSGG